MCKEKRWQENSYLGCCPFLCLSSVAFAVWRWASVTVTKLKRNYFEGSRESQSRDFRQEPVPWNPKKKRCQRPAHAWFPRHGDLVRCSARRYLDTFVDAARCDAALAKATQLAPMSRKWSQRKLLNGVSGVTQTLVHHPHQSLLQVSRKCDRFIECPT